MCYAFKWFDMLIVFGTVYTLVIMGLYSIFWTHIILLCYKNIQKQHTVNHKSNSIVYQWFLTERNHQSGHPNLNNHQEHEESMIASEVSRFFQVTWNRCFLKPPTLKPYGIESTWKSSPGIISSHECCFGYSWMDISNIGETTNACAIHPWFWPCKLQCSFRLHLTPMIIQHG